MFRDPKIFGDNRSLRRLQAFLGIILIAGGALSFYDSTVSVQQDDMASLFPMICGEVELLGGLWLLLGVHPAQTRPWVVAAMIGVWISSVYQLFTGKCSSNWFGSLSVNPWLVLFLSLAALVLLLRWPHSSGRDNSPLTPSTTLGLGITALLVTVAGVSQQPLIVLAGVANLKGHPIKDTALKFRGNSIEVEVRTDEKGYFRLPPIRPGQYTVSMIRGASPLESNPDPVERRIEGAATRKSRDRAGAKTSARGRQEPSSESIRMYTDTEITVLDVLDGSTNSLVIEFE
jgi:uncharacterized membrane protein